MTYNNINLAFSFHLIMHGCYIDMPIFVGDQLHYSELLRSCEMNPE